MKNYLFLALGFLLFISSCTSDKGWKSEDYELIPVSKYDEDNKRNYVSYLNTKTGDIKGYFFYGGIFKDGLALVLDTANYYYFIDKNLKPLNNDKYIDATSFSEGLAWVVKSDSALKTIDKSGATVFDFKDGEIAMAFNDGMAVYIDKYGKLGAVNKKGIIVVEPKWNYAYPMFVNGKLIVRNDEGKYGLIDKNGEILVECQFYEMGTDKSELFQYNYVQALEEDRIPFQKGNCWGIINSKGRYVINPQFDKIVLDGDDYLFEKNNMYGWCDDKGSIVIEPVFKDAIPFGDNEYTAVENENREYGYINKEGEWAINPQFSYADRFLPCGLAVVADCDEKYGLIDKKGRYVLNPNLKHIYNEDIDGNFIAIKNNNDNKSCIIDKKGNYIIRPRFDSVTSSFKENSKGLDSKYIANSDYVDVNEFAKLIEDNLLKLKSSTAGELIKEYSLEKSDFPKYVGSTDIYNVETALIKANIKATDIKAWYPDKEDYYSYKYVFVSETPVNTYAASYVLNDRAKKYMKAVFNIIAEKYNYDTENNTLSLPNCEEVKVSKGISSIRFFIKTK